MWKSDRSKIAYVELTGISTTFQMVDHRHLMTSASGFSGQGVKRQSKPRGILGRMRLSLCASGMQRRFLRFSILN